MRIVKLAIAALAAAASIAAVAPVKTDVPADPALVEGTLPNGLHYEILKNQTPPHNAALRLRIDAGALEEQDDERGVAHFVEHMAMAGTRGLPGGEMIRRLERAGLRYGPDTNAFTDFRQTWYVLNLPETDEATLGTALTALRETVGEATFPSEAVERERGIIVAEERSRATAASRSSEAELKFLMRGDLLPERFAIGLPEIVRTIPRERLVRFYDAHYRPERATLIAVGDFDPAKVEAEIRRLFSTWHGRGRPGGRPPAPHLPRREAEAAIDVDPALPLQVSLAWVGPADLRPDSRAVRGDRFVDALGLAVLRRRIGRISAAGGLVSATVSHPSFARRAEATSISGIAKPGRWKEAMQLLVAEQQGAMTRPVGQGEIDREIAGARTALEATASGAATRDSAALAQQLLTAVADQRVFTTPAERLAEFEQDIRLATPERVTEALRRQFAGAGPLIYLTSPTPIDGGETAVVAAWQEAIKAPGRNHAEATTKTPAAWPYTSFGHPGEVAERREIDSVAATAIRFANGVRLTVKKTAFAKDEVLVGLRIGHGRLELRPDQSAAAYALATGGLVQGGLGRMSVETLRETLATRVYSLGFTVADDGFALTGRTRPADLDLQLQLLTAYATDAALRPGPWARLRATAATTEDQLAATPAGVLAREGQALLRSGDPRWRLPPREAIEATTPADARALYAAMRLDPLEVVIVGDIDVDAAVKAVAATLGALPPRAEPPPPPRDVRFPPPGLVTRMHKGRADQALAVIAWPTTDLFSDQKKARALNLLAQVFRLRLLEEIREKLGISYSPSAGHYASESVPGYGYLSASVEVPPDKIDSVFAAALRIAAGLRERLVAADELERARRPVVEGLLRDRSGNGYWLGRLIGVQTQPEALAAIVSALPDYQAATPADLQAAARAYLADDRAWKLAIVPEAKR